MIKKHGRYYWLDIWIEDREPPPLGIHRFTLQDDAQCKTERLVINLLRFYLQVVFV
jgi:hypothetical protein